MKLYKCPKKLLKWRNIPQIDFKWNLPILTDENYNVLLGNSLKECLNQEIIIIVIPKNELLQENLFYMESKIVEENSEMRFHVIYSEVKEYLNEYKKPKVEYLELFDEVKNKDLITEENYIVRHDQFKSHGYKKEIDDYQIYLPGFEEEIKKEISSSRINEVFDFEIDYQILEELL